MQIFRKLILFSAATTVTERPYRINICPNFTIYKLQLIEIVYLMALIIDNLFRYNYKKENKENSAQMQGRHENTY